MRRKDIAVFPLLCFCKTTFDIKLRYLLGKPFQSCSDVHVFLYSSVFL